MSEAAPRFTAEVDGVPVGSSWMDWWDEQDGTRLYVLRGDVDARWRRRGIGRSLLAAQEELAAAHWRAHPDAARALLGANADDDRPDVQALLRAAGYRIRFTVVELARATAGADPAPLPGGLTLRDVEEDHHPLIHRLIQDCFADSGNGQQGRDWAGYRRDVRDTDLWLVAWYGDEIAALVVNERSGDGTADSPWVAVAPAWRRRGVAQVLLRHSLRRLAAHGIRTATIRTVQENRNRTVELYEKAGYRVTARHPRWAKPLGGEPPG
jgi:mycothiol synthase